MASLLAWHTPEEASSATFFLFSFILLSCPFPQPSPFELGSVSGISLLSSVSVCISICLSISVCRGCLCRGCVDLSLCLSVGSVCVCECVWVYVCVWLHASLWVCLSLCGKCVCPQFSLSDTTAREGLSKMLFWWSLLISPERASGVKFKCPFPLPRNCDVLYNWPYRVGMSHVDFITFFFFLIWNEVANMVTLF